MSHETKKPNTGTVAGLCLMLAASVVVPSVSAMAAEKSPGRKLSPNAALVYWQAFALLPDVDAKARPPLDDWKKARIDDTTRKLLKQADGALRLLYKAAAIDACDWGVDWSDGPGTLLPHLGKVRRLAKLAMLRARVRLSDGKTDAALADIAAALWLSRHVGSNGVLVEMLVQFAIEGDALEMLGNHLPKLTARQKKTLAGQLDRLPAGANLSQAILAEKAGIVDWMIGQARTAPNALAGAPGRLKGKSKKEILALLEDLGGKYVAVSSAAALPADQAAVKLDQLEKAFRKSPNPFVPVLLPTVTNIFKKQVELFKQRKALRARLLAPAA